MLNDFSASLSQLSALFIDRTALSFEAGIFLNSPFSMQFSNRSCILITI